MRPNKPMPFVFAVMSTARRCTRVALLPVVLLGAAAPAHAIYEPTALKKDALRPPPGTLLPSGTVELRVQDGDPVAIGVSVDGAPLASETVAQSNGDQLIRINGVPAGRELVLTAEPSDFSDVRYPIADRPDTTAPRLGDEAVAPSVRTLGSGTSDDTVIGYLIRFSLQPAEDDFFVAQYLLDQRDDDPNTPETFLVRADANADGRVDFSASTSDTAERTLCFGVRAVDVAGNIGARAEPICAELRLDAPRVAACSCATPGRGSLHAAAAAAFAAIALFARRRRAVPAR